MFWQRFSKARHKKVETTKEGPRTKWMETWLSLAFRISRLGHPVCRLLKIRWRRSVEDNPSLTLLNLFISISSKPFHRHWQFLSSPNHWPESSLTDEKVKRIDDLDSLYSLHLNMPHNVYGFVQIPHSRIFDKLRVDKGSILNLPSLLVLVSLDLNIGDSYIWVYPSVNQILKIIGSDKQVSKYMWSIVESKLKGFVILQCWGISFILIEFCQYPACPVLKYQLGINSATTKRK